MPDEWLFTKEQDPRIIDVVALGPFMIWYAFKSRGVPEWARTAMFGAGILTIVYNGANYFARQEYDIQQQRVALLDDLYSDGL